jgi:hypothetical protein
MMASWPVFLDLLSAVAQAGESAVAAPMGGFDPGGVPAGEHPMHTSELAGIGSAVVTSIVGLMVGLDRFGVFDRKRGAETAPVHVASPPNAEALESIRTRLTSVETKLGTMEQTIVKLDTRDRSDSAALARMDGRIESWDVRLRSIEAALTDGKR